MYFPENMTFQYFFFDTYPGCFLQVLPVALLTGLVYGVVRFKRDRAAPVAQKIWSVVFVCYLTGLIALTVVPQNLWGNIWYWIFYGRPSGARIWLFTFDYNFIPDFLSNFDGENLMNILLLAPFAILHPLACKNASWNKTVRAGVLTTVAIELVQPVFGRAFDINDIILNVLGVVVVASVFFLFSSAIKRR